MQPMAYALPRDITKLTPQHQELDEFYIVEVQEELYQLNLSADLLATGTFRAILARSAEQLRSEKLRLAVFD